MVTVTSVMGIAKVSALTAFLIFLAWGTLFVPKNRSPQEQQLEVKAIKWQPGSGELRAIEVLEQTLTNTDFERLRALGLSGSVAFVGSGIYGSGPSVTNEDRPKAYVIIVLQRPVKEGVNLDQPDRTNVIYVQTNDGWKMYPSDAKTLQRKIRLAPDSRDPEFATLYMVDHPDGSKQGGTLITW